MKVIFENAVEERDFINRVVGPYCDRSENREIVECNPIRCEEDCWRKNLTFINKYEQDSDIQGLRRTVKRYREIIKDNIHPHTLIDDVLDGKVKIHDFANIYLDGPQHFEYVDISGCVKVEEKENE